MQPQKSEKRRKNQLSARAAAPATLRNQVGKILLTLASFDACVYIIISAGFFALTLMPDDVKFTSNRKMADCFVMILFAY